MTVNLWVLSPKCNYFFYFLTGYICVSLDVLELTLYTTLAMNSEIHSILLPYFRNHYWSSRKNIKIQRADIDTVDIALILCPGNHICSVFMYKLKPVKIPAQMKLDFMRFQPYWEGIESCWLLGGKGVIHFCVRQLVSSKSLTYTHMLAHVSHTSWISSVSRKKGEKGMELGGHVREYGMGNLEMGKTELKNIILVFILVLYKIYY